MPWMATSLGRNTASLAEVKVCVQEVFNNIQDHSTEVIGCVVGQYYPKLDRIDLAISDFGIGIPRALQSYFPDSSDADLVMRATEQGITSKPNGRNQGQGLSLLIDNIVGRFGGYVRILSGRGLVRCVPGQDGSVEKTTSSLSSYYPGALVRIRLFAQNLPSDGPEVEELDW
jgi:anti-sigma regulatory factor (Ser/Thr protein kinase)